jgi:hypothetical protein
MAGLTEQDLKEVERVASAVVTLLGPRPPWQAVITGVELLGLSTQYLIKQDLGAASWAIQVMEDGLNNLKEAFDKASKEAEESAAAEQPEPVAVAGE